jgi:hypothetical protein
MRLGHQARTTAPGGRPHHKRNPPISRLPGYVLLLRTGVSPAAQPSLETPEYLAQLPLDEVVDRLIPATPELRRVTWW